MANIELIKQWLKLFWEPAVFVLNKEWTVSKAKSINIKKYFGLESAITINDGLPYQLAFSPNWQLGKVNVVWQDVHHEKTDAEEYVAALVIDLDADKSSYDNKKDYLDYIIKEIESTHIKISYLVETGRWYHAYIFIREQDRNAVGQLLNWTKLKELECELAWMFDWWDKSSHSIVKLMRLPWSKYRKWYPSNLWDFTCKLMKFTWDNKWNLIMENVTKPEQISLDWIELVWLAWIKAFLSNIENNKDCEVKYETQNSNENKIYSETCENVNQLDIVEVIWKLSKYPREYKWNAYIFKVYNWTHIWFLMNGGDELITTDGYMINKNKNFVHCFSDCYHPIEERPRGQTYAFLFHYFKWNRWKMDEFLRNEYWITIKGKSDWAIESYLSFDTDSWTFEFSSDWVRCSSKITKRIFPTPFFIKWTYKTRNTLQWETEDLNTYYLVTVANDKNEFNIKPIFDRKKFNASYWWMWLATKATENELIDMWHWLSEQADKWTIPTYDYKYMNWYYDDVYIIWNKAYDHNAEEIDVEPMRIILDAPRIEPYNTSEDITVKEFWAKFRGLYSDRESMLMFTTFITLLTWHRFRVPALEQYITQVLVPWLFLSGKSQSGKTTAITICKHGFWLSTDSKKFSVKWATAQPINQASTDSWLLHLEERTGRIDENKETIVRNILNKTTVARWLVSGDNVFYNYKASVVIDGETSPSSESVANRCIYIPFYKDERIGNVEMINSFAKLSYRNDFIQKLYQINKDGIRDKYQSKQKLLMGNWLTDRVANNYAYILCVNEWFDIYDEKELLSAILQNMELEKTVWETRNDLSSLLTELLIGERIQASRDIVEYDGWYINRFIIPIPDELFQKHKVNIMWIIRKYSNKRVQKIWSNLVIKYNSADTSDINTELYNIISLFISRFTESYPKDIA